jgi:ArsR family transcriptional regulator
MNTITSDIDLLAREEDLNRTTQSIKAMAHPLRLKILFTLNDHEASVNDIADSVGTSQSNISQHLSIMREKGLLTSRKVSNQVFYRIDDSRTLSLINMIQDVY